MNVSRIGYAFGLPPLLDASIFFAPAPDLNILSMRSVIRNPPTMLLVAQTTAMNPSIVATRLCAAPAAMSEPTSEMPEIAFVAAMSGVCSSGGTREMTMYPTNAASTKT